MTSGCADWLDRFDAVLRPKVDGGQARFYTLVSRESSDQDFALHRQLFLAEQGYRYEILDDASFSASTAYFSRVDVLRAEALGEHHLTVESSDNREQDMRKWLQDRIDIEDKRIVIQTR